jgi:hypothetical protein
MFLDLGYKLKNDIDFRHDIQKKLHILAALENSSRASDIQQRNDSLMGILRMCDYNLGVLAPYYFPNFADGKPLSFLSRPFSFAMTHIQVGGYTCLRGSRQIGKSTGIVTRQRTMSHIFKGFSSIYIVPHGEHLKTYATRYREMERMFRFNKVPGKFRQNLTLKEYPNGSKVEMIRVLTSAHPARGKSASELIFDEVQQFDSQLLPEIQQIQKASKMPMTTYAGTSLTTTTFLETLFANSSQGMWHVRAGNGKDWLNTGDVETALKIIRPQGPTCPITGKILNMEDGLYVHAYPEVLKAGRPGFHIPQIIIPDLVNNPIKWDEIYQAMLDYDSHKFIQEVLGIPTQEGEREITETELHAICTAGSKDSLLRKAQSGHYRYIVSGCDWGGSDYNPATRTKQSFTVHCILGIKHNADIDILHFKKYSSMGYREIVDSIMGDHVKYKGNAIATDAGVGSAYNMLIRESGAVRTERHFIFRYAGPNTAPLTTPKQGHGEINEYGLNRTDSITTLYDAIKRGRIRCYDWSESGNHLLEFLNLYRTPSESASGVNYFTYTKHGSKPDDPLHACNFAFALARVMIGEPIVNDRQLQERLQKLLSGNSVRPNASGRHGVVSG